MPNSKRNTRQLAASLAVIGLVAFGAAGCSSGQSAGPSSSPTVSASPTPTPLTDAQALAAFKSIAEASVAKADKTGLTETTVNSKYGNYILVLDRAYNPDYQAAVQNADGTYALIYESDAFAPAAAVSAIELGAKVSLKGDVWVLTEVIEGTPTEYDFKVADGLIVSESGASGGDTWTSTLEYSVDDAGHKILDEALKTLSN